jgi:cytochrome c
MTTGQNVDFLRLLGTALLALLCGAGSAYADLRGHGGPVRAVAASPDGRRAISGSFDTSAIVWSLGPSLVSGNAEAVLRFHEGAVNAVAFLNEGRMATAGEDARIAIWKPGEDAPARVLEGHRGPIVALAASPDGSFIASGAWDHTARLWSVERDEVRAFEGHRQNVNGVAFTPDGRGLVTVGYDASLRIWPISGNDAPTIVTLPAPLNAVAVAGDGEVLTGAADGRVYFISPTGQRTGAVAGADLPITALALSPDGKWVATASMQGGLLVIERQTRAVVRAVARPGAPVWSVTFLIDSSTLLTGCSDGIIRPWSMRSGAPAASTPATRSDDADDPLAHYAGDAGAQVFRACVACHTLHSDRGNRAGPSLGGIFGRRIATLPGYNFSPALKKLDIVWTPETLSKLFEIGPSAYTPGTKMPEQRIESAQDRAALIEFLKRATRRP